MTMAMPTTISRFDSEFFIVRSSADSRQAARTMECANRRRPEGERSPGSAVGMSDTPPERPWPHRHPGPSRSCCGRGATATTSALEQLMPLVEAELRRLARGYMGRERRGHTLQTTALVNEAFLRLTDARQRPLAGPRALPRHLRAPDAARARRSRAARAAIRSAAAARSGCTLDEALVDVAGPGVRRRGAGSRTGGIGEGRRRKSRSSNCGSSAA